MSMKLLLVAPLVLITIGISEIKTEHSAKIAHQAAATKSTITKPAPEPSKAIVSTPASTPVPTPPPTPVPTPVPTPRPVARPLYSTGIEQWRPLVAEYFPGEVDYALRIMRCESGGNAYATGYNSNGTADRGLLQINSIHSGKVGGNLQALYDPATNLRVAKQIRNGSGWGAWSCSRKI